MLASKLPRVVPTRSRSGLVHGLSWKWTGRPNHSMAARHGTYTYVKFIVVLAERKLTTYVNAVRKQPIGNL
ncbi:hypothetical protein TIFTF001_023282 [Ficus carica]|uniref:Uncharacterized protein n=1 Tax=Ficus carica TaxID=3494 RepID=A0AA88AJA2_FICCA|nr:hypothetical protein TIFTF001_023282 [Ficus carica]